MPTHTTCCRLPALLGCLGFAAAWLAAAALPSAQAAPPCVDPVACKSTLDVGGGLGMPFYRTHALREGSAAAERAVIVVHGNGRNPRAYFRYLVRAAQDAGELGRTVVVAPHFLGADRKCKKRDEPAAGEVYWTCASWKSGEGAENAEKVTSFDVLDLLLQRLLARDRFPKLRQVVVTGHSAGGQVTQRYAASNRVEGSTAAQAVNFRYIVANPSSFTYLDRLRPSAEYQRAMKKSHDPVDWSPSFTEPKETRCRNYDRWRYGLGGRTGYVARLKKDELRVQLAGREVVYLLGLRDHAQDKVLDKTCPAKTQGPYRLGRGHAFFHYMRTHWKATRHSLETADCKHQGGCMYGSAAARKALFR